MDLIPMDLIEQRYRRVPGRPSIDGYAVAKGWFTTLGLWLGGSLTLAIWTEVKRVAEPNSDHLDNLHVWPFFALVSVALAMVPGLPLALLLDRLLRGFTQPLIHVAAFFALFTLLPAVPWGFSMGGDWILAYGFSSLLGICAAAGRAAAFRRGGAFRRPTTWV